MNKEEKLKIQNLIVSIETMYPYRLGMLYDKKINFIIEQLQELIK